MNINEKLNALLADPAFYEEGKDVASVEDFVKLLHGHDITVTEEEADAVLAQLGMLIAQQNGELSEEELGMVAGGYAEIIIGASSVMIKSVAASTVFATGLGLAVGIAAVAGACYLAKRKGWI